MQYTVDQIEAVVSDLPMATVQILLKDLVNHVLNNDPLNSGTIAYIQLSAGDLDE